MKRVFCIALFFMTILLMGCGDIATSQSESVVSIDSSSENPNKEQTSESFLESNDESESNNSYESLGSESDSNESHSEKSNVTSDVNEDDSTAENNSEVEMDFSEFE